MTLPKILIAACLVLLGSAGAVSATPLVVGDCSKFGGACASVCAEAAADCGGDALACVGVSYQVPQCVETGLHTSSASRCAPDPCDSINLVCEKVLKQPCVAMATDMRAGPDPVAVYSCFNGGITIVVQGRVVAECVLG